MLIVDLIYKKPLSEVEQHVQEHRDFLQGYYDKNLLIASGPKIPKKGGVIIANMNLEAMQELIKQDPFYRKGIAEYKITEFDPVKKSKGFETILPQ